MFNPGSFHGKNILVTGASSGIGAGLAKHLSELGARVVLCGRNTERLEASRANCAGDDHLVKTLELEHFCDHAVPWFKSLVAELGSPLDGVVHSAGVSETKPLRIVNEIHYERLFQTNVQSAIALLKAAASKGVLKEHGASVVLIASIAGLHGIPGLAVYGASKGAIVALGKGAARELAPKLIRVNTVAPGLVGDTPMAESGQQLPGGMSEVVAKHHLGLPNVDDVCHSIAFLLSDAAKRITGTVIAVDGGYGL